MSELDPVARVLRQLIHEGSISRSKVGARASAALRPLFDIGALKEERSAAGWRLVVSESEALSSFAKSEYPNGLDARAGPLDRSAAVALVRDAKRGANLSGTPVLIRGFTNSKLFSQKGSLDVRAQTELCGAACFVLSTDIQWRYEGKIVALVENLEPFLRFEERFPDYDGAIYCAGRMGERLLDWVESQIFDVVHFGDYDPVGLQEYLRLRRRVGERASFFAPPNLHELVERFGKPKLLRDSGDVLSGLRGEADESVRAVLHCLEDCGCGLEQEILWSWAQ